ncbi:acyl-CoA dehydrogenase family protein [Pseudomonas sp. MOB-449]|nr:acyl-CoA dehydrogenase family protein [Pseudomonas sp. MOB-449]
MTTDIETIAMLRDSLERYSADQYDFLKRWSVLDEPVGYSPAAWSDYAAFGWLALRLPEEEGGLAADATALGAVMEVVGSRLLMEPLLASAIIATGLVDRLGSQTQRGELLPALAEGRLKLALAEEDAEGAVCRVVDGCISGVKQSVLHGDCADSLLVTAQDECGNRQLYLLDPNADGIQRQCYRLVDGRGAANLRFDGAPVVRLDGLAEGEAEAVLDEALDAADVALCAEALGAATCLLNITNEYLKVRKQFGRPLAANQALQHRMADLYLLKEEIRALTRMAQQAMALPAAERARRVSGARAYIAQAARKIANEAIQLHGGVGVTEELEVSHYFRRLMVNAALFGGRDWHFNRFVDSTLKSA